MRIELPGKLPFAEPPVPNSEINLAVCQGIGDIIWVYQKFAPYFDRINFKVLSLTDGDVSRRALPWLKLLPKVRKVQLWIDRPDRYRDLAAKACRMQEAFRQWKLFRSRDVDYSCNRWLEAGVRIEDIDPDSRVLESVDLKADPFTLPFERYAVLYVSGDTRHEWLHRSPDHRLWDVEQWTRYVKLLWARWGLDLPIVVTGAAFDEPVAAPLCASLRANGLNAQTLLNAPPGQVVHLLKKSDLFIGYQSGLNVVADLLDVRQVMIYFPHLFNMHYAWCKPAHRQTRFFADTFAHDPADVVAAHQLF